MMPAIKGVSLDSENIWSPNTLGREYIFGYSTTQFLVQFNKPISLSCVGGRYFTSISSIDSLSDRFDVERIEPTFRLSNIQHQNAALFVSIGLDRIYTFIVPEGTDIMAVVQAYTVDPSVSYAEPDYIGYGFATPNDPSFNVQWGLNNDGTNPPDHPGTADADIDAPEAWDIQKGSSSVTVAMLDTGVDWDHPDLSSRIWSNADETAGNGIDDDHNGYVDDTRGWDFVNNDNNPMDDHGHGTVNAGIVGADTNNAVGVAGVDWRCKIMPVKVLNQNNWGLYSWWASGLQYAADNGADVISMSMGGTSTDATLKAAVDYAYGLNCVICVSMGNDNSNTVYYPAAYSNVIAVGAVDTDDTRCVPPDWQGFGMPNGGSNYGSHIDVVAPGNWIYSTVWNNNYQYWAGTSMAAPFVSGLAALLFAQEPTLTNAEVYQIITTTAEDQVGNPAEDTLGWDQYYGYGRINAHQALEYLLTPQLEISSILGGTGITAVLNNTGWGDATTVSWNISITGGLFVSPRTASGSLGALASHTSTDLTMSVFGIGLGILFPIPVITVRATCAEGASAMKSTEAKILFSKVIIP
jgi:subtilisin family serine protease